MSWETTVVCDGCGVLGDSGQRAHLIRRGLRSEGWREGRDFGVMGGKDYCGKCVVVLQRERNKTRRPR